MVKANVFCVYTPGLTCVSCLGMIFIIKYPAAVSTPGWTSIRLQLGFICITIPHTTPLNVTRYAKI